MELEQCKKSELIQIIRMLDKERKRTRVCLHQIEKQRIEEIEQLLEKKENDQMSLMEEYRVLIHKRNTGRWDDMPPDFVKKIAYLSKKINQLETEQDDLMIKLENMGY